MSREVPEGRAESLVVVVAEVLGQVGGRLWASRRRSGTVRASCRSMLLLTC